MIKSRKSFSSFPFSFPQKKPLIFIGVYKLFSGETGIRTLATVTR